MRPVSVGVDARPPVASPARARVLIVDDSSTSLRMLADLLKDDYQVQVATDGPTALQVAQGNLPPDLILLDVEMEGMDGYEVCEELKARPESRDVPVIFLTGRSEALDEERGLSLGAVDYIAKPFAPALVRARIALHLRLQDQMRELVRQRDEIAKAYQEIKTLRGIVPICSSCKNIRTDNGYWQRVDQYVSEHTNAQFTHGICPDCVKLLYPDLADGDEVS